MDLSLFSYNEVHAFLQSNLSQIESKSCDDYEFDNNTNSDVYELITCGNNEYFERPDNNTTITYGDCYYYILKYNDDSFYNQLSVLDCGGYYIAVCIFKNKINITNEIIFNKKDDPKQRPFKFNMNTTIGDKCEIINHTPNGLRV